MSATMEPRLNFAKTSEVAVRNLPSGTVTFLFTDIEGSTKLLRELGEGYAAALAEHHRFVGLRSIAFGHTLELRWPDESKRGFAGHLRVSEFRQARRSNAAVSNRELSGDTRLLGGAVLQRCGTV